MDKARCNECGKAFVLPIAERVSLWVGSSKAIIKDAMKIVKPTTKIKDFIRPNIIIFLLCEDSAFPFPGS
jgi:hypothetical protein